MSKKMNPNEGLLARVNFPLYAAEMLTSRHLLVAGGGGSSKTGVANGFEIFELYHDGVKFVAEEVVRHETGGAVVMNCSVKNFERKSVLVAGQESHSQMYIINSKVSQDSNHTNERKGSLETVRNRKNKEAEASNPNHNSGQSFKRVQFEIKPGDSIQTDFAANEPLQRVVRISKNGKFMVTGGEDGHVRVYSFPRMSPLMDITGHTKEIDDLDFSPDNKSILSIAKDGIASIWSTTSGKEVLKLKWTPPEGVKYLFKRGRYATIENNQNKYRLFTLANPFGKSGSKHKGYLQQWNPETGKLNNIVGIDESLSALAVRDDGRFLAVGTMFSGSVQIYIAFSLQRVLNVTGAHSMFVTGLEFLPVLNNEAPAISSDCEAAVVSISVDNRICIHTLQYRHTFPAWAAIVLIVIILFLTFMLCSYFDI